MAFRYASGTEDPRAGMWEVTGEILHSTQKAIKFKCGNDVVWLPRAKIILTEARNNLHSVAMPDWLWQHSSLNKASRWAQLAQTDEPAPAVAAARSTEAAQ